MDLQRGHYRLVALHAGDRHLQGGHQKFSTTFWGREVAWFSKGVVGLEPRFSWKVPTAEVKNPCQVILERDQDYIWQYQIENNCQILSEITAKVDGPVFIFDLPNAASNSSKLSENTVQEQPYIIRRTAIVCCTVFKTFEARQLVAQLDW